MNEHHPRKPVIVGVDGSPQSVAALRHARRLAGLLGCPVRAMAIWQYPVLVAGFPPGTWDPREDAETVMTQTLATAFGSDAPADLEKVVEQGQPAQALIDASRDAEMVIVGSRGRGGFKGLLLGSVSSAIAAHAHCPVLIIHGSALEDDDPAEGALP